MTSDTTRLPSKILLVDDERSIRITLSEFLKDENYEVEVAEDAQQAMEMLSRDDFDVVVTDIIMPRITGVKLLEAIRESAPRVQVILMTGEPTVETASKAVRADAFDYLTKPISKGKLIRTVANAVKVKTLDDEHRRLIKENLRYQENLEELVKERTAALQRKHRELTLLNRIIATTSTTLDSRRVLETICRELALAFDVPQAAAALLDKKRTTATVVAEYLAEGRPSAMDIELPVEGNFATQYVIEHKAPLSIVDAQHDPRFANIHEKVKERGTVSMLLLPLLTHGEVVGTLGLDSVERYEFSSEEINLAANAVAATSQALENARLYQTIQRELGERVRAEKALQKSEEKFRVLYHNSPDMYASVSLDDARILLCNETLLRETGYSKEEIVGIPVYELYHDDCLKDVKKVFQQFAKTGKIQDEELILKRKDGSKIDVNLKIDAVRDNAGKIRYSISSWRDITARKEARQILKKYANQLETLNTVTAALSTSLELDEVLELILQQIGRVIPLDSGAIFLHEEEGVRVVVDRGIVPSVQGLVFPAGSPLFREIEQTRVPLVLSGVKDDDRFRNWGQSENVESWMGIPLIVRDTLIGFCTLDSFQLDAYSSEQADLALLFASQAAQVIENARQYSAAERRAARLNALRKIDQAITDGFDIEIMMKVLLENLLEQLQVDAAVVLQYEESLQLLSFCQGVGFHTNAFTHTKLRLGSGQAGKVALERRPIFIPNLNQTENKFFESPEFKKEGFHAYQSVPLITKGVLVGVLEIFHRSPLNLDSERMDFLNVLAGQAAIAIDNVALFNDLQYSNTRLMRAYDATIEGWAGALELKDQETEGHSRRVVEMTTDLAQIFNIREDELLNIRRGALLHDIGKMGVPDRILQKKGALTEEEWKIMRLHPVYAFEWLSKIEYLCPALDIPHYHHEKWDGSGYPLGLKEEQIPFSARLFAIVDVWDALRSDRPYRKAWSREKTLKHIQEQSGMHFDPRVVTAFLDYIEEKGEFLKE